MAADTCVYAIGDIHGEIRLLDRLLDRIADDARHHLRHGTKVVLVFLGDYVDRGPDSRAVLDRLIALPAALPAGGACRFLRGNHEAGMVDFLRSPRHGAHWLAFGGSETLASYGIPALAEGNGSARLQALGQELERQLPPAHRHFLDRLESHAVYGDYVFVHAGLRPGVRLDRQKRDDMMWIREPFLSSLRGGRHTVVHGHTITDQVSFHPHPETPLRIGVDTGAYASGVLSAVRLHGHDRHVIDSGAGHRG